MNPPADVKPRFRRFADTECKGYSDILYRLSVAVSGDDDVADFIAAMPVTQPNLFFAAIQLLTGPDDMPQTGALACQVNVLAVVFHNLDPDRVFGQSGDPGQPTGDLTGGLPLDAQAAQLCHIDAAVGTHAASARKSRPVLDLYLQHIRAGGAIGFRCTRNFRRRVAACIQGALDLRSRRGAGNQTEKKNGNPVYNDAHQFDHRPAALTKFRRVPGSGSPRTFP